MARLRTAFAGEHPRFVGENEAQNETNPATENKLARLSASPLGDGCVVNHWLAERLRSCARLSRNDASQIMPRSSPHRIKAPRAFGPPRDPDPA